MYLASRLEHIALFSLAGASWQLGSVGTWRAVLPKEQWPDPPEVATLIEQSMHPIFGDRQQELVLIGQGMDEASLRRGLASCLLTAEEVALGKATWRRFPDSFPRWT